MNIWTKLFEFLGSEYVYKQSPHPFFVAEQ